MGEPPSYRLRADKREDDGHDIPMWVAVYHGYGMSQPPEVLGALVRPPDGAPRWVEGWRDGDDPKSADAAWEYYEEGWGSQSSRAAALVHLADAADAAAVVDTLQTLWSDQYKASRS